MGMGVGAAMTGLRPIVEGMNMGFLLLAFNQISNNCGMLHYTSGGQFKVGGWGWGCCVAGWRRGGGGAGRGWVGGWVKGVWARGGGGGWRGWRGGGAARGGAPRACRKSAASTRTRTCCTQVPMVIRGPGGVGRQLGAEHSQRLESYFQSIPGGCDGGGGGRA